MLWCFTKYHYRLHSKSIGFSQEPKVDVQDTVHLSQIRIKYAGRVLEIRNEIL